MKVDISREDGDLSVSISKNGEEITDIPGATVEIPKSSGSGTRTVLTDEEGNSYTGMVNETQNVAVIPVDKTGECWAHQRRAVPGCFRKRGRNRESIG